jgi:hypothetical protein
MSLCSQNGTDIANMAMVELFVRFCGNGMAKTGDAHAAVKSGQSIHGLCTDLSMVKA